MLKVLSNNQIQINQVVYTKIDNIKEVQSFIKYNSCYYAVV